MKYQKIINLLDNSSNQPIKFRTKNWVEINDVAHGAYNTNTQIKIENSMLKSSLCDYSDAYILKSGTITIGGKWEIRQMKSKRSRWIFKTCSPFTDCINEKVTENANDLDVLMLMYKLIE